MAITLAYVGSVIGEQNASNVGIGNLLTRASAAFEVPLVWAALVVLAVLGVSCTRSPPMSERSTTGWAQRSQMAAPGYSAYLSPPPGERQGRGVRTVGAVPLACRPRLDRLRERRPRIGVPELSRYDPHSPSPQGARKKGPLTAEEAGYPKRR